MDINKILKTDYLDLIYNGRNKTYGSYELRRNYPKRVGRALMALAAIGVAVTAYGVISNRPVKIVEKPKPKAVEMAMVEPPPIDPKTPPPPPPPAEPPPPVKPTVKFTPPVIKKDEEVREEEKPPEMKELKDASAGVKTQEGDVNGIDPGIIDKPGTGTGTAVVEAPPPPPAVFTSVEQMPEFNGDVNAWLANNVQYPDAARESGIEGRVVVKFVVAEDGSVTEAQVERGVNAALDAEALRAIRKMPKWKPGKQNGQAVKVYYRVPVKFQLD
ncbi:MAG: energy transducer TonB [Sphingobacteriales bacterium]|nr:MAG: energy transducer TonB [Sphingobacteriales bacterium]